jgi:hypothetical protein
MELPQILFQPLCDSAWIPMLDDIEKVFLNLALQPTNEKAIRFLWSTEPNKIGSPLIA